MRHIITSVILGTIITSPLLAAPPGTAPAVNAVDRSPAISVITHAELAETAVTDIASLLDKVPGVQSYRYGDNPRGTATLDRDSAPAATPDRIGAMVLQPGSAGFDGLTTALSDYSAEYATVGNGLLNDKDYLFFVATRDSAFTGEPASGLATQIDFPIGFEGAKGWVAQPAFPGDTWQGASLVLSGQLDLKGDFQASLIDTTHGFKPVPFDGMFATGIDWAMAAVDWKTLSTYNPSPVSWAFASHVHDGKYGSCATCASIVTAYPAVPRASQDLFPLVSTPVALEEPSTGAPAPDAAQSGFPLWLTILLIAIILIALVFAFGWFWLARRTSAAPTPCDRERRAWEDAKRRLATAREFLESQNEAFNKRMARVGELEALLAEYESALDGPTAGTGGKEYARLDGELILVSGLKELIAHLKSDLTDAQADAERERVELDRRLAAFTQAEAEEAAARAAYEACIAAAAASAEAASAGAGGSGAEGASGSDAAGAAGSSGTASPGPATPSRPSVPAAVAAPPVATTPSTGGGCTAANPVAVAVGAAQRFRLFRDFDVISRVEESSQHGADTLGTEMVTGLKDAGTTLTTIGNALSGAGAAKGGAKAVSSLQSGQFVKGSLEAVKGTVDGLGAIDVIPNVPTSLPEAVAQGLAATANLGAFVAGKVTEWMGKNTMVSVHASFYYQTVTIQPTQIWVCEEGMWRCKTKVNVYTVGSLQRERGREQPFTVKSEPERRRLRAHLATLASQGRLRITNSVAQIAAWEAANPTGACP